MNYVVMISLWNSDYSDNYCLEYSGIKHNSEDEANRELFLAKIHECDNEFLNCLYVKEN